VVLPLPMLLILGSGLARLRGVVPITLAGLLVFGTAPYLGSRATEALVRSHGGGNLVLASVGVFGRWAWYASFVLIALPIGWVAWTRVRALARAYEAKRFSDVQLLARAWWLLFVVLLGLELSTGAHPVWGAIGCAAAYLAFVLLNGRVFSWLDVTRDAPPARNLLLLRVFGHATRTGRLFDRIGARWRYFGPVTMIAAPDVIARTINPADYLRYMLGTVDESFVRSAADLHRKLDAQDGRRDPDGRFRVNEFCCAETTWKATVVELMLRAHAVVMDLRGITPRRRGCEFELQQLAALVDPLRVVLVVDGTTDMALVRDMLGPVADRVRFRTLGASRLASSELLFRDLLRAAHAGGAPAPSGPS
jgi:hypothetical protein